MTIAPYPKLYNLGHRDVQGVLDFPMHVEEKVDGSQFTFGVDDNDKPFFHSKSCQLDETNGQFKAAIETVQRLAAEDQLCPGFLYRAEFLGKARHNVLAYDRTPKGHLVLFDVQSPEGGFCTPTQRQNIAERMNIDAVPVLDTGTFTPQQLARFFERESFLGGVTIEGVVIKGANGSLLAADRMAAKFVSPKYHEVARSGARVKGPFDDPFAPIAAKYGTVARWQKAVQHLQDAQLLENSPKDIQKIIREIQSDIMNEEGEALAADVMKIAKPKIMRGMVQGVGDWYIGKINAAPETTA